MITLVSILLGKTLTAYGQLVSDYAYYTGVDATRWISVPSSVVSILTPGVGDYGASGIQYLGFSFPFGEAAYTQFSVNTDGNLRLGSAVTGTGNYSSPFSSGNAGVNSPKINFFGCDGYATANHNVRYLYTVDSHNDSVGVVEFCLGTYSSTTRNELYKWQVHLYPSGVVEVVYGEQPTVGPSPQRQQGMCVDATDGLVVDNTHMTSPFPTGNSLYVPSGYWPAEGRYYHFEMNDVSCPRPLSVQVHDIDYSSMNVSWVDTSEATSWIVHVESDAGVAFHSVVTTQPLLVTGLTPSMLYTVRVAPICQIGDTGLFRMTTAMTPCSSLLSIPYSYDFEDATCGSNTSNTFVSCWFRLNNGTTYFGYPYVSNMSNVNHTLGGSKGLYWYNSSSQGAYGDYQCVVLPAVDTSTYSIHQLRVRLWARASSSSYSPVLKVGVMTDPNDIDGFVDLGTVSVSNSTIWEEYICDLSLYSGMGRHIAIKGERQTASWYVYLDDIAIEPMPTCPDVESLEVTNIAATSSMLSWQDGNAIGHATRYRVEIAPQGSTLTTSYTTTNQYMILSGLLPETTYEVSVTALCGANDYGASDTASFTTICIGARTSHIGGSGGESSAYTLPINNYWRYSYTQQLILASEMNGATTIEGIRFNYASSSAVTNKSNCTIYLAHTNMNSLSTSNYVDPSTMTVVYVGPMNVHQGWNDFSFTVPFYYNGTSNLVVAVDDNSGSYPGSSYVYTVFNSSVQSLSFYSDSYNPDPTSITTLDAFSGSKTTYSYRADMELLAPCDTTITCLPPNVVVTHFHNNELDLAWAPGNGETSWNVDYRANGGSWVNVASAITDTTYSFTDLQPSTEYDFRVTSLCSDDVASVVVSERTACSFRPFNYDNLEADYVRCTYGTYTSPEANEGVVDNGYESSMSRHTVHYDSTETDPRTGNMLYTVPEGYCSSVRLGNWNTNSQAERIVYTYTVDTNDADLLLLKYASVLQDPGHDMTEQPRFTFRIVDRANNTISPCYEADFIANASLGWASYGSTLWKDWTTVGVDLSLMHGETIKIELTTYDCSQGAHYGYAYFVLDLTNKALKSNSCSGIENTFYAPQGFNYSWFRDGDESNVLSTTDSLHVSQEGEYHCRLSFVGAPNDQAHSDCYFIMTAVAGVRYPYARFTPVPLDTSACQQVWMRLLNQSIITSDQGHLDSIGNGCESYYWSFDDGTYSTENNPRHGFTPGRHTVTLYSMLADGACVDSVTHSFLAVSPCMLYDTVYADICEGDTLWMFDSALYEAGEYTLDSIMPSDSVLLRTLFLNVVSLSFDTVAVSSCAEYLWPYNNQTYNESGLYSYTFANSTGCDSVVTLDLTVTAGFDTTLYDTICSNQSVVFEGVNYSVAGSYSHSLVSSLGCDSIRTLELTTLEVSYSDTSVVACDQFAWHDSVYTQSTFTPTFLYLNSDGCDSIVTLHLTILSSDSVSLYDTICEGGTTNFAGQTLGESGEYVHSFMSMQGCDSVVVLHLSLLNTTYGDYYDTCLENQLPRMFMGITAWGDTAYEVTLANSQQCDSVLSYHLHVLRNNNASFDTTICSSDLPLLWHNNYFYTAGTQYDTLVNYLGADSIMALTLHVISTVHVDLYDTICSNQSLTFEDSIYSSEGIYPQTFISSLGCDSIRTLYLSVNNVTYGDTFVTACDQFVWYDSTYIVSTTDAQHSILNAEGCDSIVMMHLQLSHTTYGNYYDTCLENQLPRSYMGIMAWRDTSFTVNLVNSQLCDSLLTYHLHVLYNNHAVFDTTLCDDQLPLLWHHRTFYSAGTQYDTLVNHLGADSVLTLTLHVNSSSHDTYYATACDSYLWHDSLYTESTTGAQYTTVGYRGCDSVVTLHLTVNHSTDSDLVVEACDSYDWFGTHYLVPPASVPTHTLTNAAGCDSLLRLTSLVLHYSHQTDDYDTVCLNEVAGGYPWRDTVLYGIAASGGYSRSLTDMYGCDSLLTLTLTVRDSSSSQVYDTIVENQASTWQYNGIALSADTTLRFTLANQWGCDSVVTYRLHVYPNVSRSVDTTFCDDGLATFEWNGLTADAATDSLVATLVGQHGVDSVVTLRLHVNPTYHTVLYDTVCDNAPAIFGGRQLDTSGSYGLTLSTQQGCDSVVTLHLTVHATYDRHYYDTIYVGDTVEFEGGSYVEPGTYTVAYSSVEGCDSTMTLHLFGRNLHTVARADSICQGDTFYFYGRSLTEAGTYYDTAYSGDFFAGDTVVVLTLSVVQRPPVAIYAAAYCDEPAHYVLRAASGMPYLMWEGTGVVEGRERDSVIAIPNPADSVRITLYADYRAGRFCPGRADTVLTPIPMLHPLVDVRPTALTLEQRRLTAYNAGSGRITWQQWKIQYNQQVPFTDTVRRLRLDVPVYVDSVVLVLSVANEECQGSDSVTVGTLRADIYFPNVFTPSLRENNLFRPSTVAVDDYELWIYDRRGALVFHTTDIEQGWDGTHEGRPLPQAAYVYKCRYRDQLTPSGYQSVTGTVTLLR